MRSVVWVFIDVEKSFLAGRCGVLLCWKGGYFCCFVLEFSEVVRIVSLAVGLLTIWLGESLSVWRCGIVSCAKLWVGVNVGMFLYICVYFGCKILGVKCVYVGWRAGRGECVGPFFFFYFVKVLTITFQTRIFSSCLVRVNCLGCLVVCFGFSSPSGSDRYHSSDCCVHGGDGCRPSIVVICL